MTSGQVQDDAAQRVAVAPDQFGWQNDETPAAGPPARSQQGNEARHEAGRRGNDVPRQIEFHIRWHGEPGLGRVRNDELRLIDEKPDQFRPVGIGVERTNDAGYPGRARSTGAPSSRPLMMTG